MKGREGDVSWNISINQVLVLYTKSMHNVFDKKKTFRKLKFNSAYNTLIGLYKVLVIKIKPQIQSINVFDNSMDTDNVFYFDVKATI